MWIGRWLSRSARHSFWPQSLLDLNLFYTKRLRKLFLKNAFVSICFGNSFLQGAFMPKPLMLHAEMRYGQWCSDALILVLPGRLAKSTGSAHKFASILEKTMSFKGLWNHVRCARSASTSVVSETSTSFKREVLLGKKMRKSEKNWDVLVRPSKTERCEAICKAAVDAP